MAGLPVQDFYSELRLVHIAAVVLSGALFAVRGLALNVFAASWPLAGPARRVSHAIDTVLLVAALPLMVIVGQYPFVDTWLTVKLAMLVVYIGLGTYALRRGRTRLARIAWWLAALAVYAFIVSVARARDPLGVFAPLV